MAKRYAFLDSGIGGLPYFEYFHAQVPQEKAVYVADTAHFPYGEKTREEVIRYAVEVSGRIINRFAPEVIVIVCNTISLAALDVLRTTYSIPFVGTVPAVKPAAELSKKKHIGIIATGRTVHDPHLETLIRTYAAGCRIEMRADADLVFQIEHGLSTASDEEKKRAIEPAVRQFKEAGADTLILGCTHFLHLADSFIECAAPEITIIDSRPAVIAQALRVLPPVQGQDAGRSTCYVTGALSDRVERLYRSYCSRFDLDWGGTV